MTDQIREKQDSLQYWKRDGFRGEKMIVLPTESFQDYVEHPVGAF